MEIWEAPEKSSLSNTSSRLDSRPAWMKGGEEGRREGEKMHVIHETQQNKSDIHFHEDILSSSSSSSSIRQFNSDDLSSLPSPYRIEVTQNPTEQKAKRKI